MFLRTDIVVFEVCRREVQSICDWARRLVSTWWHWRICPVAAADASIKRFHSQLDPAHHLWNTRQSQNEVLIINSRRQQPHATLLQSCRLSVCLSITLM